MDSNAVKRWVAVGLCALAACAGGGANTLELTLDTPDAGRRLATLGGETGFLFDGAQPASLSWPDVGTWGKDVPLGVLLSVRPLQPGRVQTGGSLHLGADTVAKAETLLADVTVERVRWTGAASRPWRIEGSFDAGTPAGHQLSGRFASSPDDCSDKVKANGNSFLCGRGFPKADLREQRWKVGRWDSSDGCPAALLARYGGGTTLTVSGAQASAGGQKSLACVQTYANAYRVVCGASEKNLLLDGCSWSVTAIALPGVVSGYDAELAVFAGTVGGPCAAKFCVIQARDVTHESGAQP